MLTVHHLENSRSQRILWLLEEMDLDYELKVYPRNPDTQFAPPELKQLHPLGKAPLLIKPIVKGIATRMNGGFIAPKYPKLRSFLQSVRARPAYQAAIKKGGPFHLLSE